MRQHTRTIACLSKPENTTGGAWWSTAGRDGSAHGGEAVRRPREERPFRFPGHGRQASWKLVRRHEQRKSFVNRFQEHNGRMGDRLKSGTSQRPRLVPGCYPVDHPLFVRVNNFHTSKANPGNQCCPTAAPWSARQLRETSGGLGAPLCLGPRTNPSASRLARPLTAPTPRRAPPRPDRNVVDHFRVRQMPNGLG